MTVYRLTAMYGWLLFLAMGVVLGPARAEEPLPSFFNSKEIRSTDLAPFKKWTDVLERFSQAAAQQKTGSCKSTEFNKCHYDQWMAYLVSIKDKERASQIADVNSFMNRAPYIADDTNWGMTDYWATPLEFFDKFGDCEDYAIAKYLSLRFLGFTEDELRVVAVKDLNLKAGHAILVVLMGDKTYVLDNQIPQVIDAAKVRHYQPVFSINSAAWWRHRV